MTCSRILLFTILQDILIMEGIYKVKIVPNDLSMEETVLQIADTLDNLNGIVDDIFTRISTRIDLNTNKTRKLQERIDASRTKVEKLAGMQKAIKVFSSAKYPSAIVHEHYQSIFDTNVYNYEAKKVTLSGKSQRQSNEKAIQEKLHFFHVKVVEPKATKPKQDFDLKAVIDKASTVGDLLIYNTDESPYLVLPTKPPAYVPRVNTNVEKELLEEAPPSIVNKNLLKREIDEYMYAPGMGMVPELDMPLDLPHLPGIAGDVQFTIADDGSIAPSAVTSPVAPVNTIPETVLSELPDLNDLPDVKLDATPDIPDAPPVPPAPVAPVVTPAPLAPTLPSLPPPPPPPPPADFETPKSSKREERVPAPAPAPAGDAHSSLMAAIRQAGGVGRAKLKPAAESTPAKGGKASIGGDLMADLHAKLSMRRRGISGAERSAGGSVLHTLASVIPEPGDQSEPQRSSSDDDWD